MASGELAFQAAESRPATPAAEPGLVERCRRGDPQAFAGLVALHEGMVLNLAARLLGDAEEARDIAQDVFLQVYRTLASFQGRSTLRTWIYRIVVNQCRNRQRWWRRRRRAAAWALPPGSGACDGHAVLRAPRHPAAARGGGALVRGDRLHARAAGGDGQEPAVAGP